MLKIAVVDSGAESRSRILREVSQKLASNEVVSGFLPHIDLRPYDIRELRYQAAPDICIIGTELIQTDLAEIHKIKNLLPTVPLIARIDQTDNALMKIEQLARYGVSDFFSSSTADSDFIHKIILHTRKPAKKQKGKIILCDSGKGGLGVSTLTAALGEGLMAQGKKVLLIDLDFETQDLSRFLQVRPFINENLQSLLEQSRPITEEFIEQCIFPVWDDEENLSLMPPVADSESIYDSRSPVARNFFPVLEVLNEKFDVIIIDRGCSRDSVLKSIYRLATDIIYVINNDPAALYASSDIILKTSTIVPPSTTISVIANNCRKDGLPVSFIKSEFTGSFSGRNIQWSEGSIPSSKAGYTWPGSGSTLYRHGGKQLSGIVNELLGSMGIINITARPKPARKRFLSGRKAILTALPAPEKKSETIPETEIKNLVESMKVTTSIVKEIESEMEKSDSSILQTQDPPGKGLLSRPQFID